MVSAASFSMSKMPPMLSGIVPMTKQLNSVTERPVPAPASDAACGQIFEILQRGIELFFPLGGFLFHARQITRDATPAILDRTVDRLPIGIFHPVFHVPDLFGDRGGKAGHQSIL